MRMTQTFFCKLQDYESKGQEFESSKARNLQKFILGLAVKFGLSNSLQAARQHKLKPHPHF